MDVAAEAKKGMLLRCRGFIVSTLDRNYCVVKNLKEASRSMPLWPVINICSCMGRVKRDKLGKSEYESKALTVSSHGIKQNSGFPFGDASLRSLPYSSTVNWRAQLLEQGWPRKIILDNP